MPGPFTVRSQSDPGLDLGEWDSSGNIRIPGTIRAGAFAGPVSGNSITLTSTTSTTDVLTVKMPSDSGSRLTIDADGTLQWSDGTAAPDTNLYRLAANTLFTDDAIFASAGLIAGGGTTPYWAVSNTGVITFGDGTAARDTNLYRSAASVLATDDDFAINVAGKALKIKEGSNATMGTATCNGATPVTVSTTAVTANSRIFITINTVGGTPALVWVSSRSAGVSFAITSVAGNTSVVAWLIVEPA